MSFKQRHKSDKDNSLLVSKIASNNKQNQSCTNMTFSLPWKEILGRDFYTYMNRIPGFCAVFLYGNFFQNQERLFQPHMVKAM